MGDIALESFVDVSDATLLVIDASNKSLEKMNEVNCAAAARFVAGRSDRSAIVKLNIIAALPKRIGFRSEFLGFGRLHNGEIYVRATSVSEEIDSPIKQQVEARVVKGLPNHSGLGSHAGWINLWLYANTKRGFISVPMCQSVPYEAAPMVRRNVAVPARKVCDDGGYVFLTETESVENLQEDYEPVVLEAVDISRVVEQPKPSIPFVAAVKVASPDLPGVEYPNEGPLVIPPKLRITDKGVLGIILAKPNFVASLSIPPTRDKLFSPRGFGMCDFMGLLPNGVGVYTSPVGLFAWDGIPLGGDRVKGFAFPFNGRLPELRKLDTDVNVVHVNTGRIAPYVEEVFKDGGEDFVLDAQ